MAPGRKKKGKAMFETGKPLVTLTKAAEDRVRHLVEGADSDILGLRIGIKTAGCSGLQYEIEYATETKPFEDRIEHNGVSIFIDPTAVMFLVGSVMDWEEDKFASRFVFNNPNEIARCGCGESFTVANQK